MYEMMNLHSLNPVVDRILRFSFLWYLVARLTTPLLLSTKYFSIYEIKFQPSIDTHVRGDQLAVHSHLPLHTDFPGTFHPELHNHPRTIPFSSVLATEAQLHHEKSLE